jgi:hypothetical protein
VERRGRGCGRWGCLDIIKRGIRDISAKELETSATVRLGIPGKGYENKLISEGVRISIPSSEQNLPLIQIEVRKTFQQRCLPIKLN